MKQNTSYLLIYNSINEPPLSGDGSNRHTILVANGYENAMLDLRIAYALLNAFSDPLKSNNEAETMISTKILNHLTKPNLLLKLVLDERLNRRYFYKYFFSIAVSYIAVGLFAAVK
jgi:hypothetical protein